MDAIRGLVDPGFYDPVLGYYPSNGWTVVEKADPGLTDLANDKNPMITILTDVTQGDSRFGEFPVLSWPETPPDPGPPPPTYEELQQENEALTTQNQLLTDEVDTLTGEKEQLQTQLQTAQTDLSNCQGALEDCRQQNPTAQETAHEEAAPKRRKSSEE